MVTITIGERQGRRSVELSDNEALKVEEAIHAAVWYKNAIPNQPEGVEVTPGRARRVIQEEGQEVAVV